jgi:hypothetical protein
LSLPSVSVSSSLVYIVFTHSWYMYVVNTLFIFFLRVTQPCYFWCLHTYIRTL